MKRVINYNHHYYCNACGGWFSSVGRRTNCTSCGSEEIIDTDEEENENRSDNGSNNVSGRL